MTRSVHCRSDRCSARATGPSWAGGSTPSAGAIAAAKVIPLHRAVSVLPVGIAMGIATISMIFVRNVYVAMVITAHTGYGVIAAQMVLKMHDAR